MSGKNVVYEQAKSGEMADLEMVDSSTVTKNTNEYTNKPSSINVSIDEESYEQLHRHEQERGDTIDDHDEDIVTYECCEGRHRQWLYDRVDGNVRDADVHPDYRCCTVPPCVKCFSPLLELNCVCEQLGKVGFTGTDLRLRKIFMLIGLASNLVGLFLTAVACLAIAEDFGMIRWTAFSVGRIFENEEPSVQVFFGLKAAAFRNSTGNYVLPYDEFCDYVGTGSLPEPVLNQDECSSCNDVSNELVRKVITTAIFYLPNIFTDILRMYPYYDVNCQKAFGMIINFSSIIVGYSLIRSYKQICYASFNAGSFPDESGDLMYSYKWGGGPGLLRLWIATLLKLVDVFCHVMVPVPSIARDKRQQAEYEKLPAVPISLSSIVRIRRVWPGIDKVLEYL